MRQILLWVGVGLALSLTGCATTYKADPKLVAKYQAPPPPAADQTHVYVVRGSNFQGGARGLWVAVNDKVVADLPNGSHVLLKLPAGINTVHGVQGTAGVGFCAVDNRPGETVFLQFDYAKGKTVEVARDLGVSMVMQTKAVAPLAEPRRNDAYDNLLLNPGALGLDLVTQGGEALAPDAQSAVVTFYRGGGVTAELSYSIWSDSAYLGSLTGNSYFQVRLPPGSHTFVARSERFSIVRADLEAGKHYAIDQSVGMGWNQPYVRLIALRPRQ